MLEKVYEFCKEYVQKNISTDVHEAEVSYFNRPKEGPENVQCYITSGQFNIFTYDDLKPELEKNTFGVNYDQLLLEIENLKKASEFMKAINVFISELKENES